MTTDLGAGAGETILGCPLEAFTSFESVCSFTNVPACATATPVNYDAACCGSITSFGLSLVSCFEAHAPTCLDTSAIQASLTAGSAATATNPCAQYEGGGGGGGGGSAPSTSAAASPSSAAGGSNTNPPTTAAPSGGSAAPSSTAAVDTGSAGAGGGSSVAAGGSSAAGAGSSAGAASGSASPSATASKSGSQKQQVVGVGLKVYIGFALAGALAVLSL